MTYPITIKYVLNIKHKRDVCYDVHRIKIP